MRAVYAFSGDPITYGHIDIVGRAARTYDEVVVAIGQNPAKAGHYLFTTEERLAFAAKCLEHIPNVSCVSFQGLLAEFAYTNDFDVIVKGVRTNTDLEAELVQFAVNDSLHPSLDTVFFPARGPLAHISSSVVKAIVREGGDVSKYCPLCVKEALERRIQNKLFIGIAGGIAAGKSYIAQQLISGLSQSVTASYISLDKVGHYVLSASASPIYRHTRMTIAKRFGDQLLQPDGAINRRELAPMVFQDAAALAELNVIMREPMLTRLYDETRRMPNGVILIEGAILVEADWTNLVNNNVILVEASEELRVQRLMLRSDDDEISAQTKIRRQIDADARRTILRNRIKEHRWGRLWEVTNEDSQLPMEKIIADVIKIISDPRVIT